MPPYSYLHHGILEQKPIGLIPILDELSNLPKATDLTFSAKLKHHLSNNRCFQGERGGTFRIRHHAGEVSLLVIVILWNICTQLKIYPEQVNLK